MLGHVFFSKAFSKKFVEILENIYNLPETSGLLWESIYMDNINQLEMYIRKYDRGIIFEFDTLDELREFDEGYIESTGSKILMQICERLNCKERDIIKIKPMNNEKETTGFKFLVKDKVYNYDYKTCELLAE